MDRTGTAPREAEELEVELARARQRVARAGLDPAWPQEAGRLAQRWADEEAAEQGWEPVELVVSSPAALPDVLATVARHRLAGARERGEVARTLADDLADLRRRHGG